MLDDYLENLVTARDELIAKYPEGKELNFSQKAKVQKEAQKLGLEKTFGQWTDEMWDEFEAAWEAFYS